MSGNWKDKLKNSMGLRATTLIEIALFFILLEVIDFLFLDGSRYWQISPHPFWVIVLIISTQYGTLEGLVAAAAATLILLVGNLPEQAFSQDIYDYLLTITSRPLMWFSAAVILGELRMRHVHEREELLSNLSTAEHREQTIANAYRQLETSKESLETLVAGQLGTMVSMSRAAKTLGRLDPNEALRGASAMVRAVMNPPKYSLYLLTDSVLEMSISEGWDKTDTFSNSFTSQSPLYKEVIEQQRILSLANPGDGSILEREGFFAGPLIDMENNKVLGMLKIERLEFYELNLSALESFKILCEWIGTSLAGARQYEVARSSTSGDLRESSLIHSSIFKRQTELLIALAREIGFDVFMIEVSLVNADSFTEDKQNLIHATMGRVVKDALTGNDLVFTYQRANCESVIALPATNLRNSQIIADKLKVLLSVLLRGKVDGARFAVSIDTVHRGEHKEGPGSAGGYLEGPIADGEKGK